MLQIVVKPIHSLSVNDCLSANLQHISTYRLGTSFLEERGSEKVQVVGNTSFALSLHEWDVAKGRGAHGDLVI